MTGSTCAINIANTTVIVLDHKLCWCESKHTSPFRKYTRLSVRYSRLHQSPVKYSFTAKGEIVENEDESDDADLDL